MRHMALSCLCLAFLAGCSLSGGGTTTKDTSESLITVTSVTATGTTQSVVTSDVSTGASDLADVKFQNQTKSASMTNPSPFFGVTLTHYRVVFSRGDGGPVPAPVDAAMSLFIPPPTTTTIGTGGSTTTTRTPGTASATIVIVPASAKGVSPLMDLESGKSFSANATITFEGQDGLGRDLSATGGIAVAFKRP